MEGFAARRIAGWTARTALATLASLATLTASPAEGQLKALRTEELQLVYYGTLRYLVPHVARCFENALEFHRQTFGWTPSEPVSVLLHDFYDHGNAAASSVPSNYVLAAVAPFSYAFEIIPGNEHLNWMLNHELVHVLASDMAAGRDVTARRLFRGKVYPSQEQPLSMVWSYLTSPRLYSPRWYHEGIASFMETWMAGGLGAPRAPTTRWRFARWSATTSRSTTCSDSRPQPRPSTFRSAPMPISMALAS